MVCNVYVLDVYVYVLDWLDVFGFFVMLLLVLCQDVDDYGCSDVVVFGVVLLICVCVGDQLVVVIGQGCLEFGQVLCQYGIGSFIDVLVGLCVVFVLVGSSVEGSVVVIVRCQNGVFYFVFESYIVIIGVVFIWVCQCLCWFLDVCQLLVLVVSVSLVGGVSFLLVLVGMQLL